jgi:pimeloyl-ACP methyl ester carboxylesterase
MLRRFFRYSMFFGGLWLGLRVGRLGALANQLTNAMVSGKRQPFWRSPAELGLEAEAVNFKASDGVTLRGWFIPRDSHDGTPAPAIVFVHGWPWNRMGNHAGNGVLADQTVDLLKPARALHDAGFHVLLFDLRNHGASDAATPVTFGVKEARDFVAAVQMLRGRSDVDGERIGAIGYSMGANAIMYGIPEVQPIRAAVAVQPVRVETFLDNVAQQTFGAIAPYLTNIAEHLHESFGSPPLRSINPTSAATQLGETTMLYIQGSGDTWGSLVDVQAMASATPNARPVVVAPSHDRYGGYQYVNSHLNEIVAFFTEQLDKQPLPRVKVYDNRDAEAQSE